MPKKLPPHLRQFPSHVLGAMTPETKQGLADMRTRHGRTRRERDAKGWANGPKGMDAIPEFLRPIEAAHPRAADLWLNSTPGSTRADLHSLGRRFGLSPEATDAALSALQRAELATVSASGVTMHGPGSLPF